jgi:uncharacterized delta-60 repeat protein
MRRFVNYLVLVAIVLSVTANTKSQGNSGKGGGGGGSCPSLPVPTGDTECYFGSGCLDTTFDFDGIALPQFDSAYRVGAMEDVHIQPDGKIVIIGYGAAVGSTTGNDLFIGRLNADGSEDTSFGNVDTNNPLFQTGYTLIDMTGGNDSGVAGAVLQDGKILAAGWSANDTALLIRLNPDGTLDTSFGNAGKVAFQNPSLWVQDLVVQADGKIILAGGNAAFTAVRLNPNGSFDGSFGNGGFASFNPSTAKKGSGVSRAVELQQPASGTGEEQVLLGGRVRDSSTGASRFAVMRLTANGSVDGTFGSGGRVSTTFTEGESQIFDMATDADRKIVVVGSVSTSCGGTDHAYARFTENGSLDLLFSGDGRASHEIYGGNNDARGVALQADGKIVVSGYARTNDASFYDFAVARLLPDGSFDGGFGPGFLGSGIVTTGVVDGSEFGLAVAIGDDGGIVVVGPATGTKAAGVRYLP